MVNTKNTPFTITSYLLRSASTRPLMKSIGYANKCWRLEGSPILKELKQIQGMWLGSLEALLENVDDIHCYSDCDFMEDIASHYIEEAGLLGEVPSNLQNHIDYEALGRDMEIEGNYLVTAYRCI